MLKEALAHLTNVRIVSVSKLVVTWPRRGGLGHRERAPGRLRFRERAADGPDEPAALGDRDPLHSHHSTSAFVASRLLREVARYGGDVSAFVPKVVALRLQEKFSK